jgi:hypothetical protein
VYEFLCDFPKPQRPAPNGRLSLAEPRFSTNKIVLYKVHLLTSTLGPQHRQQQLQQQGMLQILDANFEEPSEDCGPLTSTSHLRLIIGRRLVGFPFNRYRRANVVYRPRVCALAIKLASLGAPLAIGQGASGSGAAKTVAGTPCFTSPGSRGQRTSANSSATTRSRSSRATAAAAVSDEAPRVKGGLWTTSYTARYQFVLCAALQIADCVASPLRLMQLMTLGAQS